MFSFKLFSLFCILHCIFIVQSIEKKRPGIRGLLTTRGVSYVRKIAIPIIVQELNHLEIPAVSGKADILISNIKYTFSKLKLSQVKIPDSQLTVVNNSGIFITGKHLTFKLSDLWSYALDSWPFISDSGSTVVTAKNISLNVFVGVGKGDKDDLHVDASRCKVDIGDFKIAFYGGTSWLYNTFAQLVKQVLKSNIETLICKTAIKVINRETNNALKKIPDEETFWNETITTDLDLVNPPSFTVYGIQLDFMGRCYNSKRSVQIPYSPPLLPKLSGDLYKMAYLWASSYIWDTALLSVYQTGILNFSIVNQDVPSDVPLDLNTFSFIFVVNPLYNKYPDKDMKIWFNMTSPPRVNLRDNEGGVVMTGIIEFLVLDNGRFVHCFTLNMKSRVKIGRMFLEQRANHTYLVFTFADAETDISLLESSIGEFDVTLLKFTVDVISQFIITRYLTDWSRKGIVLPIPEGTKLYNTNIVIKKDCILISADFRLPEKGKVDH